jgi:hypothetical protein
MMTFMFPKITKRYGDDNLRCLLPRTLPHEFYSHYYHVTMEPRQTGFV